MVLRKTISYRAALLRQERASGSIELSTTALLIAFLKTVKKCTNVGIYNNRPQYIGIATILRGNIYKAVTKLMSSKYVAHNHDAFARPVVVSEKKIQVEDTFPATNDDDYVPSAALTNLLQLYDGRQYNKAL